MTDPSTNALISAARCYDCYPAPIQAEVQTYVLARIAGVSTDPNELARLAKCMTCLSPATLLYAKIYLLATIGHIPTDSTSLLEAAKCYECVPEGMLQSIDTYKIVHDTNSPSNDIAALSRLARCLGCLSTQTLLEVQVYLLATIAGVTTDPDDLAALLCGVSCIPAAYVKFVTTTVIVTVEDNGGISGCTDVPADLVPVITVHYTSGVASSLDILFPKVCCTPEIGGGAWIYGVNSGTQLQQVIVPPAAAGTANYQILGIDITGIADATGYFVRQFCEGGLVSGASNTVAYNEPPCDSGVTVAENWADRVVVNGGVRPSQATIDASAKFYCDLIAAGIDSKMIAINLFAWDNLIASITPLVVGPGNDPWTNTNFALADLSRMGLKGNGIDKFLNSGLVPGSIYTTSSAGMAMLCSFSTASSSWEMFSNAASSAVDFGMSSEQVGSFISMLPRGTSALISGASTGGGLFGSSRTAINEYKAFRYSSTSAFSQFGATNTENVGAVPIANNTRPMYVFARNMNGVADSFSNKELSFVMVSSALTQSEMQSLFNAVIDFKISTFGGLDDPIYYDTLESYGNGDNLNGKTAGTRWASSYVAN